MAENIKAINAIGAMLHKRYDTLSQVEKDTMRIQFNPHVNAFRFIIPAGKVHGVNIEAYGDKYAVLKNKIVRGKDPAVEFTVHNDLGIAFSRFPATVGATGTIKDFTKAMNQFGYALDMLSSEDAEKRGFTVTAV